MKSILNRIKDLPIAIKLISAILITSLLPMLGASYYNLQRSLDAIGSMEERNLEQLAGSVAGQVSQLISDFKHLTQFLGAQDELVDLMAKPEDQAAIDNAMGKFSTLVATHPEIELVMALDKTGKVLICTDPGVVGKSFNFRNYFKEAMQGRPFETSIIVGAVAGNAGMFYSSPIRNANGVISGVAAIKIKGPAIGDIVESGIVDTSRVPFIIDADGVIIYHRDKSVRYRSLAPLSDETQRIIAEDKRFRIDRVETMDFPILGKAMTSARKSGSVRYPDGFTHSAEIAGYAPIDGHSWVVGIAASEKEFSAPLRNIFKTVVISIIVVGILIFILATLFARTLLRPIRILTKSAQMVEAGEYESAESHVDSRDELGQLSLTFNSMLVGIREREKVKDVFGRMVSPEVREKLLTGTLSLGGETVRVCCLFSDIRGFSTLSEKMSAQEVVTFLNEYLTEMSHAVKGWGGYINNFIGDAIVVVFGAPISQDDIEWRAVAAALEMRDRLRAMNMRRQNAGEIPILNGIGISTGEVVAGQMGSLDRFLYTVIGDAVNVAARLEAMTKDFPDHQILINEATYRAIESREELKFTDLGPQYVKGRETAVHVYGVNTSRGISTLPLA